MNRARASAVNSDGASRVHLGGCLQKSNSAQLIDVGSVNCGIVKVRKPRRAAISNQAVDTLRNRRIRRRDAAWVYRPGQLRHMPPNRVK
jgi:hypothetical protein